MKGKLSGGDDWLGETNNNAGVRAQPDYCCVSLSLRVFVVSGSARRLDIDRPASVSPQHRQDAAGIQRDCEELDGSGNRAGLHWHSSNFLIGDVLLIAIQAREKRFGYIGWRLRPEFDQLDSGIGIDREGPVARLRNMHVESIFPSRNFFAS